MNLEPYQYVYELTRLRLSNGKPLIYEVSYLPLRFCEGWSGLISTMYHYMRL